MKIMSKIAREINPDFEFDIFSGDNPKISDNTKTDYIKEMIALTKNDKQATFMYFTFALAAIVFTLDKFDQVVIGAGVEYMTLFYLSITFLIIATIFLFSYWRKTHEFQIKIISCLPNLNIDKVRNLWIRLWRENKVYFFIGNILLVLGSILEFVIIVLAKFKVYYLLY